MCGVIGLIYQREKKDIGHVASKLLRMLEYRGYDSTGAIFQNESKNIKVLKDIGPPSEVIERLGIEKESGKLFCGQVRWATFGAVNKLNSQPHEVSCKTKIYGAHNGNITNSIELKEWLQAKNHKIISENDGEMFIHTVEHFFSEELKNTRKEALKNAIFRASPKIVGSYAGVVFDVESELMVAIKAGSSLYLGIGEDKICGKFFIACSDLSSVLSLTKTIIPIAESQFVLANSTEFEIWDLKTKKFVPSKPIITKLDVKDVSLKPPYKYFMEQEIFSQPETATKLLENYGILLNKTDEKLQEDVGKLVELFINARNVYFVACGTSHHAALTGSIFFNQIASFPVRISLPGDFRKMLNNSLYDGDVIVGISQSGETKDLIDIFNLIHESGKKISRISIVNNINSTLALEKSDISLPIFCGPEIAVPATKSFINQLILFYYLSIKVAEKLSKKELKKHLINLKTIPSLIKQTLEEVNDKVEKLASKIFLEPSIHVLGTGLSGVAKEGALKIREVVLSHCEGFESSEFKHGPNTILGVRAIFGFDSILAILNKFFLAFDEIIDLKHELPAKKLLNLFRATFEYAFRDKNPTNLTDDEIAIFSSIFAKHNFFDSMYKNYPLIFLTGPNERDINLTISQLNTHKIRGANIYLISEKNEKLIEAVSADPKTHSNYDFDFIHLPATGQDLLSIFSASVTLQLLAFKMSVKKGNLFDRLEIKNHGIHPDSPKNVSKSITVD